MIDIFKVGSSYGLPSTGREAIRIKVNAREGFYISFSLYSNKAHIGDYRKIIRNTKHIQGIDQEYTILQYVIIPNAIDPQQLIFSASNKSIDFSQQPPKRRN